MSRPQTTGDTTIKDINTLQNINTPLYTPLFDNLPIAIYTYDALGYITSFNQAAVNLWGRTPEVGKDLWCGSWKIYNSDGTPIPLNACPMARSLKDGVAIEGEEIIIERPDGTKRNVLPYSVPSFDNSGVLIGAVNTLIDITEQKIDETRQAMLAAIVDSSDDAIISKTLEGVITSWNRSAERLFGYTEQEIVGKNVLTLIPPERHYEESIIIGKVKSGEKLDHFETIRIRKNGTLVPISLTVSPIKDVKGNIIGASKIVRDITERKKAEEKQAMLAAIVDTSDDTVISKTLGGIITSWNTAAQRMFGYTEDEVIGKHISILIPPDRLKEEDLIIGNIAKGNKVDHFETIRVTKFGDMIPISLSVSPVKDMNGEIIGASKIARDISRQKTAEEQLKRYAERLEVLNSVGQVISADLDVQGILQKVTDATTQLTGAQFGAFFHNKVNEQGESYMLYTLSGAPREAFEQFGMPRNTAVFHATFSGRGIVRVDDITKDPRYGRNAPHYGMPKGHLPVVSYLAVPVIAKTGDVIGGLFFGHSEPGVFTAEHEQLVAGVAAQAAIALDNAKLYEEIKVLNSKKDEFIGLASHELKTPVTSLNGYLQIMERALVKEGRNTSFVTKAIQQVGKLSSLISDLLDVSKIQTGKLPFAFSEFDLAGLLADVTDMMRQTNTSHQIELNIIQSPLVINADQQRIEQVIINLINNAIKYSPNANKVIINAQMAGDKLMVSVKDFGIGIEQDQLQRIFSRFYRVENLAAHMSGLGIGLYISHEIISRHHGKLWVESTYGSGSTFFFEIPVSQAD